MRTDKRISQKPDKKAASRVHKRGIVGYSKKSALLEEAITHMNTGKYGRSSAALKELLTLDPQNIEARRLFATLHLRLGSLVTARQAFESLANEAIGRQDYWLAESLLGEYLAAGPRCVPFLEQLAYVFQEKGDEMAAVTELGKAIEILRDDPDPDNPQKAAQLYAKIRELAPGSSVALQLAPLFDVQTGEFLTPSSVTAPDEPGSHESVPLAETDPAPAFVEHPLPDVLPWEMTEGAESEAELSTSADVVEVAEPPLPPAHEEVESAIELLQEAPVIPESSPESSPEETTFSYQVADPVADESSADASSDHTFSEINENERTSQTPSGIPSPMPWEQMADASVQIVEPEIPPRADFSALESLLNTLRADEQAAAPVEQAAAPTEQAVALTPVSEELMPAAAADSEQAVENPPSEDGPTGSAALSAPMPWEQISDAAIQIPVAEPAPSEEVLPAVSLVPVEFTGSFSISAADIAPQATVAETETSPAEIALLPEPPPPSSTELPPSLSFSWNSVFDKAWKFTAGTMAPSPTVPPDIEMSEEPPASEIQTAETSVADPVTILSPTAPEEPPPVSCSTMVEEPVTSEAASAPTVETPPAPATTSAPSDISSHWNTGEVAVQVHRPSKKRKRWEREAEQAQPEPGSPPAIEAPLVTDEPSSVTSQEAVREWKTTPEEPAPSLQQSISPPVDTRPDWMQATDTITFASPAPPPSQPRWSDADTAVPSIGETASAAAVSAVDTLFAPSATVDDLHPHLSWSTPRPRFMARVHRVRIGIFSFIGSCFSTTRSLTFLALMITIAIAVVSAAGVAAVAVMWMVLEDPPSPLYQSLTVSPPRTITDARKNGYLLLLGFDAPVGQDPVQAGYERRPEQRRDWAAAQVCMGGEQANGASAGTGGAYDHVVKGWVRSGDPLAHVRGQGATLKSLTSRESTALTRYQQWLTMPFDDWGFGQTFSPNCPHVLLAHRLFVLEGFNQDLSTGLDRLEADTQAWRNALGQSKTLAMKLLAVTAVQDDASVVSGLLSRADLDGAALARLSKMVRPLDQVELSVRWPMQSQFVWATKAVPSQLKEDEAQDRPWHASMAAAMRLPVQRRANAYAEYYDAANKAVAGGRYTSLPKVSSFVRTPPSGVMDYLTNPLEHIVGIDPLPSWDPYVMQMIEADAQLRLAGLQAWLRRGPQDGEVLTRLAKAGQAYYDPFTGLPMLVNQRKGVIYSVGRDGKDQEGDASRDVTAMIPFSAFDSRRSAVSASLR